MSPDDRKNFVQIVGQVLISDGILGDQEREHLDRLMDELKMPKEERRKALSGIDLDSPVEQRVSALSPDARAGLLVAVEAAVKVDDDASKNETSLLAQLRELLGA